MAFPGDIFQNIETRIVGDDWERGENRVSSWLSRWKDAENLSFKTGERVIMGGKSKGEVTLK
jgi:hypothetical protein